MKFWEYLDSLLRSSEIVIDRPKGSVHPRYPEWAYPLDYGYLKGITGGDRHELDVWIGSSPEKRLNAIVCTVDLLKKDAEFKLLVGCTVEEMAAIVEFHDHGQEMAALLIRKDEQ